LVRIRRCDLEDFIVRYEIAPPSQRRKPDMVEGELGRITARALEEVGDEGEQ
jgi:hypothetical protein